MRFWRPITRRSPVDADVGLDSRYEAREVGIHGGPCHRLRWPSTCPFMRKLHPRWVPLAEDLTCSCVCARTMHVHCIPTQHRQRSDDGDGEEKAKTLRRVDVSTAPIDGPAQGTTRMVCERRVCMPRRCGYLAIQSRRLTASKARQTSEAAPPQSLFWISGGALDVC